MTSALLYKNLNSSDLMNIWDADKNRVGFSVNSVYHTFVYDTSAGIPAVIKEDSVYYIREPNGSLIARVSGSNTSYYHFDQLGSTRLLSNNTGTVTDEYTYDAYGSLLSHNRRAGSVDQPYQYVGELGYYTHYQEPEFRLLQLGVRFYDAEVGGFTQRDPIHSLVDTSRYAYCNCSPHSYVDPSGEIAWMPVLAAAGIAYLCYETYCLRMAWVAANEANEGKGDIKGNDKLAHCLLACRIKRCLGLVAEANIMRLLFILWEYLGGRYEQADVEAGLVGLDCAWRSAAHDYNGKCGQCCLDQLQRRRVR